jgi:intein/homing endonuclease
MSSSNINDLSASNNPKELMAKKNKLIPVLKRGVITEEPDDIEKVRYEFVSPNQFFGNTLNLLPMQNSVTAARAFYEHKFITQALPIKDGESPNVQSLKNADNNESYEDYLGKKTGVISLDDDDNSADILEVTPDYIKYKNDKGETKTKNLYNNFAFNCKTMLTNYPLVKAGDKISRDKSKNPPILAKTNFTDNNGTLNMGLNARVGFVPYKGWSMDDAVVISEDFAKKMTSQHMYQYSEANDSKDIKTGKDHFKAFYPDKFNKEQMDKIDDNGVIKAGTVVNPGDPLIVSTRSRVVSSNDVNLGRLSKYLKTTRLDSSQVWDHDTPGVVTDVVKTNDGYKVNVETFAPMQEGDKMCYHPDTEVFTEDGWKNITDITFKDKVAALFDRNQDKFVHKNGKFCKDKQDLYAKFVHPYHVMHYTYSGYMYEVDAPRVAYSVTPTHRIWCKSRSNKSNDKKWEAKDAQTIYGMSKMFMVSADFDLSDRELPETIKIPYYEYEDLKTLNKLTDKDNLCEFNTLDFVMFMGFYLSEGSTQHKHQKNFNIAITQTKKPLCAVIEKILNRLGFNYYYNDLTSQYIIIHQKSLAIYLKQFGTASEKFIPDWIKKLPKEGLELFIASYFNGDGDKKRAKTIWTSSYKMVQDLAYIYTLLGGSPSIHVRERFNYSNLNAKGKIIKANFPSYEIRFLEFHTASLDNTRKNNCHLKRKYNGEVYCVSVHGLGIILTRFKGKQSWQGNSTRSGNKLTVSHILPQNEMPRTKDGKPLDVLFNQLGLVSRVNANMMYEAMLGKVAEKTGKKYKLPTFNKNSEKWYDFVENELKKNNLSDVEAVYDPVIDRDLDQPIAVGNAYFLKLHHTSDSKLSSRGQGIYDQNEMPVKGGEEGMRCFMGRQVIHTLYGPIAIATLCEKRLRIPVLTFDFDRREWVYKPVTDWFVRRAKIEELITVKFSTNAFRLADSPYRIFNASGMWVTKNHLVFRKDGSKVPIGDLRPGDNLYTYGPQPTKDQLALLYGTLLGDAYAHANEDSIDIVHSAVQRSYVAWKQKILSSLNAKMSDYHRKPSESSICQAPIQQVNLSISYPWLAKKFRRECYSSNGRKTVTKEWLSNLTELSVVALFLDDGSFTAFSCSSMKFALSLYLMAFSREENQMIADRIEELTGIKFSVKDLKNYSYSEDKHSSYKPVYKGGKLVAYGKEDCLKMINLVLKYCDINDIPKSKRQMIKFATQYSEEAANIERNNRNKAVLDIDAPIGLIPVEIKSIEPYKHDKPNVEEINVYDFTVQDTHSYLAGNVLVSNSKRHSNLESNAILSSGAYNVIKDAIHLRGQRNDDYWRKVRMGQTPSLAKKSPFIWDKYIALMQGAGINAKRADNGDSIQATPFTDKDFALFNPVEIKNDGIIDFKNMKPISGGLFDPALTVGNRWGKITLDRPYPNPAFEDTIISLLGLKRSTFNDILAGKESLLKYGTGTKAIYNALSDIDIDKDLEQAKQDFKYGPKSKKQQALNRIMALDGLKNNRMKPEEFMITKVPVIPPKFRPYSVMGKDTFLPGDANELYQDVINMAHTQGEILQELGPDEADKNVPNVYKSLKALYGYGEPASRKLKQRGVSGFLQKLIGGTSKFSQWNRNVISKPVDFSARGVIDANPEISMDELGIPYEMGFEIYSPYIQRELVKRGLSPKDALQNIKDQTKMAKDALQTVVDGGRWITASRAPAWHKFNVLGFKPVFHEGKNILLPPVVSSGLGADFDGDCQWGHVFVCVRNS